MMAKTWCCAHRNTPHPSTIGKLRMKSNEGLTGWVARERRLLAISREAYKDARFKNFGANCPKILTRRFFPRR